MIFLITPSKTMDYSTLNVTKTSLTSTALTTKLLEILESSSFDTLKSIYKTSDKVTLEAMELLRNKNHYPAIELFNGAVFKNLNYQALDCNSREYINKHVKIFTALYGIISANEGISPYRLDLNNSLKPYIDNLTKEWRPYVNEKLSNYANDTIIDLASTEYRKLIDKESLNSQYIQIEFKDEKNGQFKTLGTYSKMARGQFLAAAAKDYVESLEQIKKITVMNYSFNDNLSDENKYIFTR